MTVRVFGVRHHGPGSARAVLRALAEFRPDLVLIEGPPEADDLIGLAADPEMRPPVALLVYHDSWSAFWPFASFSPEWQAMRWALSHGAAVRFCDLPAAYRVQSKRDGDQVDPLGALASAAGYSDAERWWEDVIEHAAGSPDGKPAFEAVAEAMAEVRSHHPASEYDLIREAYMRQVLRAGLKDGRERIAVVCGAWHVPALAGDLPPATRDAALLKGLKKTPVSATWVPWTHGRLGWWTGYGAGVASPGWYHHLFAVTDRPIERWLVQVAGVLRGEDLPVSSAHVIEATRLAETLAVLRGRPLPGLTEVTDATRAVLCDGEEARLDLVQRKVVVGEQLGAVPDNTPAVPLVRDVAAAQKRLRFAPQAQVKDVDLDLRKPTDLERSRLLHRLRLLGVHWGLLREERRGTGTFWESWQLAWQPEFAVDLIAASAYGTTVTAAATAKVVASCEGLDLPGVTELLEACLLADLADAQPAVLDALNRCAAMDTGTVGLMAAVPALARTLRYGDVRGTSVEAVRPVLDGLITRIRVALPGAATGLDDDAAREMTSTLDRMHAAIRLVGFALQEWLQTLRALVDRPDLPGLLAGRLLRILRDEGVLDADAVELRLARTLTVGVPPATAAGVIEGFAGDGGLLLVHDEALLGLIDQWLTSLPAETFPDVLPLLRRTFSAFAAPERRAIGEQVRRSFSPARPASSELDDLDLSRVEMVLPTLRVLIGRS